jgi:small conductance mechanosensitive channel
LLDISVAYGSDVDEASAVILDIAKDMAQEPDYERLFLDPPEVWGVEAMAADAIVIRLVIRTLPGEQWAISRELRRRIKHAFDLKGIEIPFPQRTVWLRQPGEESRASTHEVAPPSAAEGKGAAEEAPD